MKMRGAANVLTAFSRFHMRDGANVLRTVPTAHMRDEANVLRSAYATVAPAGISPPAYNSIGTAHTNSSYFTASFTAGSPTSIVWSVSGSGAIVSGQGTLTALISATDNFDDGSPVVVNITCTAVIGGVTYTVTAKKTYEYQAPGGGHA